MDSSYKKIAPNRSVHVSKAIKNSLKSHQNHTLTPINPPKARWTSTKNLSSLHDKIIKNDTYPLQTSSTQPKFSIDFSRRQREKKGNVYDKKISQELQMSLFGSSKHLRFSKKFEEDKKKGRREKKIKEENVSTESELSISSNLSYATGWKNKNSRNQDYSYVFHQRVSEKENSKERKMIKTSGMFRQGDFESKELFASLSNKHFNSLSMAKTKSAFISTEKLKNGRKMFRLKGIKKLKIFGGRKMFTLNNPKSYSTSYITKKHILSKNREKSSQKRKYREKESSSESSMDKLSETISVKARSRPDIWGYPNKEKYFLKKSEFFESSKWKKTDVKREKDIITKFIKERGGKKGKTGKYEENEILKRISKKCKKIILEQSRPNLLSRVKMRKRNTKPSIQSLMSLPGKIAKNNVQSPSITSIDPLYLHAFVKKRVKPKLKKGLSFFMAKFKSKRQIKSFFVFENEQKVVKFKKGQRNKIIEHTNDDDFDTDDEQMKLAIRQCEKDFLQALNKERSIQRHRKRALSMINLASKPNRKTIRNEQIANLQKLNNKGNRNKFVKESSHSRRQTRKNMMGNSIMSLASTVASSSYRKTKKPKANEERGRKMVKNEFYNKAKGKRRAVSILPKRSGKSGSIYQYFPKGCRKRNKMGF